MNLHSIKTLLEKHMNRDYATKSRHSPSLKFQLFKLLVFKFGDINLELYNQLNRQIDKPMLRTPLFQELYWQLERRLDLLQSIGEENFYNDNFRTIG